MKVHFEKDSYYRKLNEWFCQLIPTIAIGKSEGRISFHLFILFWEFSIDFELKE